MGHFMDDQEIEGHAKARAMGKPVRLAESEQQRALIRAAAESVLIEFEDDLTRQQRDYIADQIMRRAVP